jgi:hypothetical protein
LQRGEAVPWGRGMWITDRGVEIIGRAGRRDEVEWDRVGRVDVDRGIFRLWVEGEQRPRVQIMVGEPNFFPGYALVVQRLRGQPMTPPPPVQFTAAPRATVTPLPSGESAVRLEFAPTVEDHMALARRWYETTPEGRRAWAGRVWTLPGVVLAIGMLIGLINLFNRDMQVVHGVVALILLGGLLLRPLLGWLIRALDRARVSRELRAAQQLAVQGRGPDPFGPREVQLGPEGYVLRTGYVEARHDWKDVSRAEWFAGYVFVFLAGDRTRRETVGLILPPRAFSSPGDARELRERIEGWHTASVAAGRSLF